MLLSGFEDEPPFDNPLAEAEAPVGSAFATMSRTLRAADLARIGRELERDHAERKQAPAHIFPCHIFSNKKPPRRRYARNWHSQPA